MSDEADQAMQLEEQARRIALANRVRFTGESADECVDCGNLIPSERQVALPGVQRCVGCAEVLER